ncbi:MAG: hypothetical protein LBC99_06440 [Spirochaetota bacterium]|nr:hypothetical protein [Spirochaetota bacterium]
MRSIQKQIFAGSILAVLLGGSALFSASGDVLEQSAQSMINWTSLSLRAQVSIPWQPLEQDAAEKRISIASLAKTRALADLYTTLLALPVDGGVRVRDLMDSDDFSRSIQNFIPELATTSLPFHSQNGRAEMGLEISLLGQFGFLSMFSNHFPIYALPPPPRGQTRAVFHHSGIIVDARHLPFQPALGTRILNASGDLVYSIAYTDRTIYVQDGHILFLSDPTDPRVVMRAGTRFFLVVAKDTMGAGDLVLFDADSDHILASSVTRTQLKRCRVVVLCNSFQK